MPDDDITRLAARTFDYYLRVWGKALGYQLTYTYDGERPHMVASALERYGLKQVKQAILSMSQDSWHLGRHEKNDTPVCEPEIMFKDSNIDKYGNIRTARKGVQGAGDPTSQYALTVKAGIDKLLARRDQWPRYDAHFQPPEQDIPNASWLQDIIDRIEVVDTGRRPENPDWHSINNSIFTMRALLDEYLETGVEARHASDERIEKLKEMTEDGDANDGVFY